MESKKKIVISIATFNRPNGLKGVLDSIEVQNLPDNIILRTLSLITAWMVMLASILAIERVLIDFP